MANEKSVYYVRYAKNLKLLCGDPFSITPSLIHSRRYVNRNITYTSYVCTCVRIKNHITVRDLMVVISIFGVRQFLCYLQIKNAILHDLVGMDPTEK